MHVNAKSKSKDAQNIIHTSADFDFEDLDYHRRDLFCFSVDPEIVISLNITEAQRQLAKEIGERRTNINSKWNKRSQARTNTLQQVNQRSVFTADELGALGEIVLRDYLSEDFESKFAPLITENDTGLTEKEQAPDIVNKHLGNIDIKTIEYYRENIAIKKKQLTTNRYDGVIAIKLNEYLTEATIKYINLKDPNTKLTEKTGQCGKPNFYITPF